MNSSCLYACAALRRYSYLGAAIAAILVFIPGGAAMAENVTSPTIEKVADGLVFPEGPVWHPDGFLLFSDVHGATIHRLRREGGSEPWFNRGKKTNGLILSRDKRKIYACCYSERELLEIDAMTADYRVLAGNYQGRTLNNVNDVAVSARGDVFFTDPKWGAKPEDVQGIYRYTASAGLELAARVENQPNGIVISPDQKWLYVGRSGASDIWRFTLTPEGKLVDGHEWVKLEPKGEPDGMTVDSKGNLYVAQAGNGKVSVWSPEAKELGKFAVFERMATNCEFEGENDRVLYVTGGGKQDAKIGAVYKVTFPEKWLD